MTNAELLAKIKAEIERRKKSLRAGICNEEVFTRKQRKEMLVASEELDRLNRFLSTLESEKPVPNDLEEAAVDIADALLAKPKDYALSAKADYWNGAHDGIIAGAKWQADHTPLPEDTALFNKGVAEGRRLAEEEQADLFTIVALDAAQRAKEQMMKEAVEGIVTTRSMAGNIVTAHVDYRYKDGQKVRIIIVKED